MSKQFRVVALLLMLAILMTTLPVSVSAEEEQPYSATITLYSARNDQDVEVYATENELYTDAETLAMVTFFQFQKTDTGYCFSRGGKEIHIDPQKGTATVLPYSKEIPVKVVDGEGIPYFPASVLLPWMNVEVEVENGGLLLLQDNLSIWDVLPTLNRDEDLFNLARACKNPNFAITGQMGIVILDTILDCRWERLIPTEGSRLYDANVYKDALIQMASPQELYTEQAEETITDALSFNQALGSADELFGVDFSTWQDNADAVMKALNIDQPTYEKMDRAMKNWNTVREATNTYDKILSYFEAFSCFQLLEFSAACNSESMEYLRWVLDQGVENKLFENALQKVTGSTEEKQPVLYAAQADAISKMYANVPEQLWEQMKNGEKDDFSWDLLNAFHREIFQSLGQYLSIADTFYSTVFPISQDFESAAQIGPYSKIQDHFWQTAESLDGDYTVETLTRMRQSYILALRASRTLYQGYRQMVDTAPEGNSLMDRTVRDLDEKILKLTMCKGSELHDSSEGKEAQQQALQQQFAQVEKFVFSTDSVDETYLLSILAPLADHSYHADNSDDAWLSIRSTGSMADLGYSTVGAGEYLPFDRRSSGDFSNSYAYVIPEAAFCEALRYVYGRDMTPQQIMESQPSSSDYLQYSSGEFLCAGRNGRGGYYGAEIHEYFLENRLLRVNYDYLTYGPMSEPGVHPVEERIPMTALLQPTEHAVFAFTVVSCKPVG